MKTVDWTDANGCLRRALLPDSAPSEQAPAGIPVGVDVRMPEGTQQIGCRLQNELRRRGLWTAEDVKNLGGRAPMEIFGALQATLRVDVAAILEQFHTWNHDRDP